MHRGSTYHTGHNSQQRRSNGTQAILDADNLELHVIHQADAKKLMASGNETYRALGEKCQALKACVQQEEKRVSELEKELKSLRKAAKQQKGLESKMSSFLDNCQALAADLKITAADLKLSGPTGTTAHWTHCLAMLNLPTCPKDEDKARQLYWDKEHCNNSGDSGISTPSSSDSGVKKVKVPVWAVDLNGVQVSVKEWER
ncbi:hypothetical protein H1R20_g8094, partial [Candolleomyces eurysporus]